MNTVKLEISEFGTPITPPEAPPGEQGQPGKDLSNEVAALELRIERLEKGIIRGK